MPARLGSFRYYFEQRSKERLPLLSHLKGLHWSDLDADAESRGRIERMRDGIAWIWAKARASMAEGLDLARSDFRKVIFAAKMGIALSLVSLLIFLKEPSSDLSTHSVWVILTVVAVFEFSIGSTLSKGLNQGLGTLSAGGLALGAAELLTLTGQWDELVTIICIFITGFWATFLRLYPSMKPYEYGFRVFLLTFCFILISGLRTHDYVHMAVSRFLLIVLGAAVGFGVNICFFPIWAGEDLHSLVVKNFMGVAKSLEGCVNGYLNCVEYERVPSKILTYQASDDPLYNGYRTAVGATAQEDSLMSFAIWEPPHGPYKMLRYPWKSYVKVSGALRHCALMVTALHGCVLSEIQAPPERRQVFRSELQRVGTEGASVLRELGSKVKTMTKLSTSDILLSVHEAAEDLQKKIDSRSYLLVDADLWEIGRRPYQQNPEADDGINIVTAQTAPDWESVHLSKSWDAHKAGLYPYQQMRPSPTIPLQAAPKDLDSRTYESASALSLATFASLLIEFVARLQNLVDAFEELSEKAKFKECSFGLDEPTAYSSPGLCSRAKRLIMGMGGF